MLHATKYRLFIRRGALLQAKRLSSTTPNTKNSPPPLYRNQPDVGENQPENKEKEDDSKKEKDANAFISSLFSNPPNRTWFSKLAWPELPSVETLNKKMEELYPQFTSQFEQIREGYEHMWQFLTMEDFRKIMDEIKRDEKDPMKHPEVAKDAYVRYCFS
jgi:phospholipase A2